MNDFAEIAGSVVVAIVAVALCLLWIVSIVWAYHNAQSRGKSGCLVALLIIFLTWPVGFIAWLVFRPNCRSGRPEDRR